VPGDGFFHFSYGIKYRIGAKVSSCTILKCGSALARHGNVTAARKFLAGQRLAAIKNFPAFLAQAAQGLCMAFHRGD
jgi:hypothetical protein